MPDDDVPRPEPDLGWRDRIAAGELVPSRAAGAVAAVAVLAAVAAFLLLRPPPAPPPELSLPVATTVTGPPSTSAPPPEHVVAHAAGAVARPGVYRLDAGARVADLVDAAGGLTPEADPDRVNLAAPVVDGAQVYVPAVGEQPPPVAPAAGDTATTTAAPVGPVNLNTATAAELDTLPGVGPATAAAILEWRVANGGFTSVDQLLDVRGIGEAKLAELRPLVTV